jgi:hypothetical protein
MKNLFFIAIIFSPIAMLAQYGGFGITDARTLGMGNSGNAYHHEILPMSRNPATMALSPDTTFLRLVLPNVSARAIAAAMPVDEFNYFFGGDENGDARVLDPDDKQQFLDLFDESGEFFFSGRLNALAVSFQPNPEIGALGFSIHDYIAGRASIDKELMDVLLFGNERERTYDFGETKYQLQYTRSYQLNYSRYIYHDSDRTIKSLYGGLAVKLYQGFAYTDLSTNESMITTNQFNQISGSFSGTRSSAFAPSLTGLDVFGSDNGEEEDFTPFPEQVGSGFGFDIGFLAEIEDLDISIGVTDIGSMSWDTNAEVDNFSLDPTIDGVYKNDRVDTLFENGIQNNIVANSFDSDLPTTLRIGFFLPLDIGMGDLNLALDYNQGFNETAVNSTMPRISAGAHWKPGEYIPSLLTGLTNDRSGALRWSLGIGYETPVVDIYLATGDVLNAVAVNDFASVAFTLAWKFF